MHVFVLFALTYCYPVYWNCFVENEMLCLKLYLPVGFVLALCMRLLLLEKVVLRW